MTQHPTQPAGKTKVRKPLWRRILKWIPRVIMGLLVLSCVAWTIFNYTASKKLQAEFEKIQAAGEPLTFAQLDQLQPKVAQADDAAPYYRAALALCDRDTAKNASDLRDKLTELAKNKAAAVGPELAGEIESVLAKNTLAMEMVDRGAQKPRCAYDFGLSNGLAAMTPQLGDSRALARLLCLRTQWLARQGKTQAAVDSLISSLRMLRMFDRQPVLFASLVKIACAAADAGSLPAVLEAGTISDEQLAQLEQALAQVEPSFDMERTFVAERVYSMELCRNLIGPQRTLEPGGTSNLPDTAPSSDFLSRPMLRMMVVCELQMYSRYISASRTKWPELLDAIHASKQSSSVFAPFANILSSSFDRVMVVIGRSAGTLRSAAVAVKAKRYRLANGKLPASLDELRKFTGTALPADPFTSKDLIYKVQGDAFMVYSVGDDKCDNGGPLQEPRKDWGVSIRQAAAPATKPAQ